MKRPEAPDATVKEWHQSALRGDKAARAKLRTWAYTYVHHFFHENVVAKGTINLTQAQDLAEQFEVVFERKWREATNIVAFTRAIAKNTLQYHHKSQGRKREIVSNEAVQKQLDQQAAYADDTDIFSDVEWWQLWAFHTTLNDAHDLTQKIVQHHILTDPPMTLEAIAQKLGLQKGAVVMRWSRFKKAVHRQYKRRPKA